MGAQATVNKDANNAETLFNQAASRSAPSTTAATKVTDAEIEAAAKIIARGKVAAFTGAGVSAESGVPTYRDPGGLWRKYDMKKVSHINGFLKDPIACWRFELELYRVLQGVAPNDGHRALAELEDLGLLAGIVTQNVEGLHTRAGSRNVVELHGNETMALCLQCGARVSAEEAFRRIGWIGPDNQIIESAVPDVSSILRKEGDAASSSSSSSSPSPPPSPRLRAQRPSANQSPRSRSPSAGKPTLTAAALAAATATSGKEASPRKASPSSSSSSSTSPDPLPRGERSPAVPAGAPSCPACKNGLLKPDAIYFGEKLDSKTLKHAEALFTGADSALIIGSRCNVAPASILPLKLRKRGGKLIDVNPQGSRFSKLADVWLRGPSAEVLPRLCRAVREHREKLVCSASGTAKGPDAPDPMSA